MTAVTEAGAATVAEEETVVLAVEAAMEPGATTPLCQEHAAATGATAVTVATAATVAAVATEATPATMAMALMQEPSR